MNKGNNLWWTTKKSNRAKVITIRQEGEDMRKVNKIIKSELQADDKTSNCTNNFFFVDCLEMNTKQQWLNNIFLSNFLPF